MTPKPIDNTGLRNFGLIFAGLVAALFGLLIPWLAGHDWPYWPWYISGTVGLLALVVPPLLKPLYIVWMKFGEIMGWINTRILLGVLFFIVMLPIGVLMKIFSKDPMRRKLEREAETYRIQRTAPERQHMEKPY